MKSRKFGGDPSESDVQFDLVERPDGTVEAAPVDEEQEAQG